MYQDYPKRCGSQNTDSVLVWLAWRINCLKKMVHKFKKSVWRSVLFVGPRDLLLCVPKTSVTRFQHYRSWNGVNLINNSNLERRDSGERLSRICNVCVRCLWMQECVNLNKGTSDIGEIFKKNDISEIYFKNKSMNQNQSLDGSSNRFSSMVWRFHPWFPPCF